LRNNQTTAIFRIYRNSTENDGGRKQHSLCIELPQCADIQYGRPAQRTARVPHAARDDFGEYHSLLYLTLNSRFQANSDVHTFKKIIYPKKSVSRLKK
jgi:hypothetical protein